MNGLSAADYQILAQAHISSQFANLLIRTKGSIEQTEAVQFSGFFRDSRHIYAIGGNAEAARRAGIPVGAVRIGVFTVIGMLAGTGGGTLLLDAIAAAVIDGTSLFGAVDASTTLFWAHR